MSNQRKNYKVSSKNVQVINPKKISVPISKILDKEEKLSRKKQKQDLIEDFQIQDKKQHLMSKEISFEKPTIWNQINSKPAQNIINIPHDLNKKQNQHNLEQVIKQKSQSNEIDQQILSINSKQARQGGKKQSKPITNQDSQNDESFDNKNQNQECLNRKRKNNEIQKIDNLQEESSDQDDEDSITDSDDGSDSPSSNVNANKKKALSDSQKQRNEANEEIEQCIKLAKDQIFKNNKMSYQKALKMKEEYPQQFCIVHKKLYTTEDKYIKHTIKHHPDIAEQEQLTQFKCLKCFKTFITYGWWESHVITCQKLLEKIAKLSSKDKILFFQGLAIKSTNQQNYQ